MIHGRIGGGVAVAAGTLARLAAGRLLRVTLHALDPMEVKHAEPGVAADRAALGVW